MIETFEDTRDLTEGELRAVLASDDPRARVLAVWALGLRAAPAAHLARHLSGEPDPGVRRALAVVLASEGEIDLLVALARHDPNVYVRASASQMVARFALAGRIPWSVVVERFGDRAEVCAAVIAVTEASMPGEVRELVVRSLEDRDDSVRREAFEATLKLFRAGLVADKVLRRALERESAGECTNLLAAWFSVDTPAVMARVLAHASEAVRERALRLKPELALTELVALLGDDAELFERLRYQLKLDLGAAPTPLVLQMAAGAPWNLGNIHEATTRLATCDRAPQGAGASLGELRRVCDEQIAWVDGLLGSPERLRKYLGDYEDVDETKLDLAARRDMFVLLRDQLARLAR